MSDIRDKHREAMEHTDLALEARRHGQNDSSQAHFKMAFQLESEAAQMIADDLTAEPTRSVLLRSAASLALDCGLAAEAGKLIRLAFVGKPPAHIASELRSLQKE